MYAMSDKSDKSGKDITDDKEWLTWLKCIYSVLSSEERLKLLSAWSMKRDALKSLIVYYINTILRTYIELKRVSTGLGD